MRSTCDKENGQILFRDAYLPGIRSQRSRRRLERKPTATLGTCDRVLLFPLARPMKRRLQSLPRRWGRF